MSITSRYQLQLAAARGSRIQTSLRCVLEATIKGAGKTPPSSFSAGSKAPVSADVNGRPGNDFMTQRWVATGRDG